MDGNGTQAAIRAGYGAAGARVAAHRAITNVAVQEALQARQRVDAARLALQREDVLAGLLEAAELAKAQLNPGAMVAAWKQVGHLMGFYAPEVKRLELSGEQRGAQARFAAMSDDQLMALIACGASH